MRFFSSPHPQLSIIPPKRLACEVVTAVSDWLRISFVQFLSSEGVTLMGGFRDFGQWKHYALERFVGILHLTVRASLRTRSPIPPWAAEKVSESWNVGEPPATGAEPL
jgi:hypothetical protein